MKRIIFLFLSIALPLTGFCEYKENEEIAATGEQDFNDFNDVLGGFGPEDAVEQSIAASMVGWGLGAAVGIAVLAGVIKPSSSSDDTSVTPSHAHAHSFFTP